MWESRRFTVAGHGEPALLSFSLRSGGKCCCYIPLAAHKSKSVSESLQGWRSTLVRASSPFTRATNQLPPSPRTPTHRSILSRQYLFCHKAVKPVTIPLSWMTLSSSDGLVMESSGPIRYLSTKLLVLCLLPNWCFWTEAAALLLQQE